MILLRILYEPIKVQAHKLKKKDVSFHNHFWHLVTGFVGPEEVVSSGRKKQTELNQMFFRRYSNIW
jgi:hypothetical protein